VSSAFTSVEVVGAGLIGTSIALRVVKNGGAVRLLDTDPGNQRIANQLMGSSLLPKELPAEVIVAAAPVDALPEVICGALQSNPHSIVIDIGSVKTKVIDEVWTKLDEMSLRSEFSRYLPTHPMAGRELAGPSGARSDLFEGRAWAITPHHENGAESVAKVGDFVATMGATGYLMSPNEHDNQVALTSHLPQILASALAGSLTNWSGTLNLAGQGLRDMTRLAHSEPSVWGPIIEANGEALAPWLDLIFKSINKLKDKKYNREAVLSFMEAGNSGLRRIPGKHGGVSRDYGALSVVIPDRAGQLAALFNHCADVEINIEDLRMEHSPGQETGLITLYVQSSDLSTLENHLSTLGWHCTIGSKNI